MRGLVVLHLGKQATLESKDLTLVLCLQDQCTTQRSHSGAMPASHVKVSLFWCRHTACKISAQRNHADTTDSILSAQESQSRKHCHKPFTLCYFPASKVACCTRQAHPANQRHCHFFHAAHMLVLPAASAIALAGCRSYTFILVHIHSHVFPQSCLGHTNDHAPQSNPGWWWTTDSGPPLVLWAVPSMRGPVLGS